MHFWEPLLRQGSCARLPLWQAFSCEEFDNGRSFLRADVSVECGSPEHDTAQRLAWLGIFLYVVGTSLLYIGLLWRARHAIREAKPTRLSNALALLVRDVEPQYFW